MKYKNSLFYICLLLLLTTIFFWGVITNPKELFASGDLLSSPAFSAEIMHQTFQSFSERALWNPYVFAGKPFIPQIEYGQYYITSLLFLFVYKDYFFNFIIIAHFFLAGLFMYLFLRSLNLRPSSAAIGAVAFMFSRTFSGLFWGDTPPIIVYAYIPLVFLALEKLLQKKNLLWSLLLSIFCSLQFFAGKIQYFYYVCLGLTLYAVIRIYQTNYKKPIKNILPTVKWLTVATIIFFGITAIQLIPMLEVSKLTIQTNDPKIASYEFSIQESVPLKQFITLLIPDFFGKRIDNTYWGPPSWLLYMYLGVIPLILALVALLISKNPLRIPLIILLVFVILFSLGSNTPFYKILHANLPGVSMFKVPGRMLVMFSFIISILAAMGNEHLITTIRNRKKLLSISGIIILLSVIAVSIAYLSKQKILSLGKKLFDYYYLTKYANTPMVHTYSYDYFAAKIPIAFNYILLGLIKFSILLIAFFLVIYFAKKIVKKKWIGKALLLILILDVLFLTNNYDWDQVRSSNYPGLENSSTTLSQWDPLMKELNNLNNKPFRIYGTYPAEVLIKNNLFSLAGSSDSMVLYYSSKHDEYLQNIKNTSFALGLSNVKYILTQDNSLDSEFTLINNNLTYSYCRFGANKTFYLYENKNWMPRAFVVPEYKTQELEQQFETITNWTFNPKKEVLVTEDIKQEGGQEYKEADITFYSPNKVQISVETEKPGYLVISDTYYPGWKAYVNGEETKIYHANYIMRAIHLPAGENKIEFAYDPMSYKIGKWITLTTLIIIGILAVLLIISRKKTT